MNNLIDLKNIIKSYNNEIKILNNINFSVNQSDLISIIGPSGSGKTSLLNIIGSLDSFNSGTYQFNNIDVLKLKEKEKNKFRNKNIGFIHQFHYLIPELTSLENIILPLLISNLSLKDSIEIGHTYLKEFKLEDRKNIKSNLLSGGEQQRVSIARAMINSPSLILADEMTGNLDEKNSELIFEFFINKIKQNQQTLIFVTHNNKLANIAKVKYKLENGSLERYL
ncbi:MAG: Lipoprotein-releasing system ATP-binding protein LolD [Alphaproteobacteria bacterium MarineAlpha5_Bin12]|nr:MAG: Lipoprotein-releasing system ATP-binding protein LolD [Alphaproteobacteria bacterium MarineAlpha5_Bin12]|tara:strand:- start:72118 stop:72789 length:672 start_codon:yes stop_codon:yes gene_type:complete